MLRSAALREVQEFQNVAGKPAGLWKHGSGLWHTSRRLSDYRPVAIECRAKRMAWPHFFGRGMKPSVIFFATNLIEWQREHGRHDLPWQATSDAYHNWLTEIMLQQTQVATVIPYYQRFLARFPTIESLAQAALESVLEHWAGLGYYARARNLHRCAQVIVFEYRGQWPTEAQLIAKLPGIGRSTAAAISAFAFGTRSAILDGNVKRVLARCFAIEGFPGAAATEKEMWNLAESLLPERDIASYTQGLMDLGSSLCTRRKPFCVACPMYALCLARRHGRQAELPVARPRKVLPERKVLMFILIDGAKVLLERRPPAGIWGGMLVLPEVPDSAVDGHAEFVLQHGCQLLESKEMPVLKHIFSHFHLIIRPVVCYVEHRKSFVAEPKWEWLGLDGIESAALPTPVRTLLGRVR